uniref:Uncharacterized protein n=1 Tax=Podoviridae sp. ctz6O13 TaxID=2827757 RepID=A0A8S5TKV5_9CAUD|nr:MAG TPA: hypothetical protein [Podoviridae sp. ctz6O13]
MVVKVLFMLSFILSMLAGHIDCLRQMSKELPQGLPPKYVGNEQVYRIAYHVVLILALSLFCMGIYLMEC